MSGSTYRTCVLVNVSGTTGGACGNWVFQGRQSFLSTIGIVRGAGHINSRIDTQALNSQMETLLLNTWICDGHGDNCSIATQQTVKSYPPAAARHLVADVASGRDELWSQLQGVRDHVRPRS